MSQVSSEGCEVLKMKFVQASVNDLEHVLTWVETNDACLRWGGPKLTFPIDLMLIQEEISYEKSNSFVIRIEKGVVAFGQLLEVEKDRYHMARIIVKPSQQGLGYGRYLCEKIVERVSELKGQNISLRVFKDNHVAIGLYKKLGFLIDDDSDEQITVMMKSLVS